MKNYLKGVLGGLLCGMIASLPWILVYIFMESIVAILAIPIALGVNFGYRKFGGSVDKNLPFIIAIVSLLIILIACLLVLPLGMLAAEGFDVSLANLKILYNNAEFMKLLWQDTLLSLVFAILGIGGVIAKIRNEVKDAPVNNALQEEIK